MSASKTWLHQQAHLQNCVATSHPDLTAEGLTKQEREEMCIALSATQESALIQLLLEMCLPTQEDKEVRRDKGC